MFGYTCIKTSELDSLRYKCNNLLKDMDVIRNRNLAVERSLRLQLGNAEIKIIDLEEEVLKYKTLYLEEVEKRLAMAKAFKDAEED